MFSRGCLAIFILLSFFVEVVNPSTTFVRAGYLEVDSSQSDAEIIALAKVDNAPAAPVCNSWTPPEASQPALYQDPVPLSKEKVAVSHSASAAIPYLLANHCPVLAFRAHQPAHWRLPPLKSSDRPPRSKSLA